MTLVCVKLTESHQHSPLELLRWSGPLNRLFHCSCLQNCERMMQHLKLSLCVFVCACVCAHVACLWVRVCTCYMCTLMCVDVCAACVHTACVCACVYVYACVCGCICMCMSVRVCAYMCMLHVHAYIYMCMCACVHRYTCATVHMQRSEYMLGYWSSPSTFLDTHLMLFPRAHSRLGWPPSSPKFTSTQG